MPEFCLCDQIPVPFDTKCLRIGEFLCLRDLIFAISVRNGYFCDSQLENDFMMLDRFRYQSNFALKVILIIS